MHRIFRVKAYEKEHGPHFNEEYARKAVMKMENEDGTRGPHWSLEETTTAKCDEEMSKCQALLEKLDIPKEPINTEDPRIKELQDEINELKNIIKQASSMVPPPMKQMLPQNMQNVMKEVDQ